MNRTSSWWGLAWRGGVEVEDEVAVVMVTVLESVLVMVAVEEETEVEEVVIVMELVADVATSSFFCSSFVSFSSALSSTWSSPSLAASPTSLSSNFCLLLAGSRVKKDAMSKLSSL